jgi:hypothetical protein
MTESAHTNKPILGYGSTVMLGSQNPVVETITKGQALFAKEFSHRAVALISDKFARPCPDNAFGPTRLRAFLDPGQPNSYVDIVNEEHVNVVVIQY